MKMQTLRVELLPAQLRIWNNLAKRTVIRCGRRFGKSSLAVAGIADICGPGGVVLYTAPTYPDLEKRFAEFEQMLKPVLKPARDFELRFRGGGRCEMFGLHNHDSIRSNKYHRAINDEFAYARYAKDAWQLSIRPTLTDYGGDAWFLSTPRGKNFFHVLSNRARTTKGWIEHHYPTSANPFISKAEIQEARDELPEIAFRQEYLAEFVEQEGTLVKPEMIQRVEILPQCDWYMGVDLAFSTKRTADFSAIVIIGRADGKIYVADVWRGRGSFEQLLGRAISMAEQWQPNRIGVEEVGGQTWFIDELLQRTNLPVKGITPTGDKVRRFYPLMAQYERGNVYHYSGVPGYFDDELLSFTGTTEDDHDDTIDAASYGFSVIDNAEFKIFF